MKIILLYTIYKRIYIILYKRIYESTIIYRSEQVRDIKVKNKKLPVSEMDFWRRETRLGKVVNDYRI